MNELSIKTVVIAVGIFVTIIIVTIVFNTFYQMQEIYGIVATTDISIHNKFDDAYSMYDGTIMTGLGLLNTIKKYEDNNVNEIEVKYPGSVEIKEHVRNTKQREAAYLKSLMEIGKNYKYETKYNVKVETLENGKIVIEFNEK